MKTHYYKEDILDICDEKHLTVDEIFQKLNKKYPEAGKSSVYRNVEEMVETGDLRKIIGIGKKAFFEKSKGNHIHLIDKKTGNIYDLEEKIKIKLPKNFLVSDLDVKIFGEFKL